ncbi:MAG: universal stress protein [Magnetovibrio sp.]|nr:universal stress protein [Magnetovibrio sp.]
MSIRTILVPLDGASDNNSILSNAFELARTFNAHVNVMHVRADARDAVPLFGEGLSGDMVEEMITSADKESVAHAEELKTVFERQCFNRSIPVVTQPSPGEDSETAAWIEFVGREDELLAWHGRLADLIIMSRPTEDSSPMRSLSLEAALFECGRPVLALPPKAEPKEMGRIVGIAWNGTAESARAVQAAIPILEQAYQVNIFTCVSEKTYSAAGDELAAYLGWRGITPKVIKFDAGPEGIGMTLLDQATNAEVDMLVCGAYSHSRLMQAVLGGVTSSLMELATIPVLFSH